VGYATLPGLGENLVLAVSYPAWFVQSVTNLLRWIPAVNWICSARMTNGKHGYGGPWTGLEVYLPKDLDVPACGSYLGILKKKDVTHRLPIVTLLVPME